MGVITYFALFLILNLAHSGGEKVDFCTTVHSGSPRLNKVHVPNMYLPVRMQKVIARIPDSICGCKRRQVGVSVVACDVVATEQPKVQVLDERRVRVHRIGYGWLSERGALELMVSCEDIPKVIEFEGSGWRRRRNIRV